MTLFTISVSDLKRAVPLCLPELFLPLETKAITTPPTVLSDKLTMFLGSDYEASSRVSSERSRSGVRAETSSRLSPVISLNNSRELPPFPPSTERMLR